MPQPASTRLALVGPSSTDLVSQGDDIIRALIAQMELRVVGYGAGTEAARPAAAAANADTLYRATDTGRLFYSDGAAWAGLLKAMELPLHATVAGEVRVPSGNFDVIPQLFVPVLGGQTAKLKRVRYGIGAGTSATFKIQRNGADVAGLTGLVAAAAVTETALGTPVTLANNDRLQVVVTAVSGTPQNLSAAMVVEHGGG